MKLKAAPRAQGNPVHEPRRGKLKLLSGTANPMLARKIAEHLDHPLSEMEVRRFSDGEFDVKIEENVRGADVFVVQPTCAPVNENLMQLFIILDSLRRASAGRVTVVLPYYGYARKEKKSRSREPITAKLVSNIITLAGADRVMCVDLHADAIQGFFDIPVDHLTGEGILADHVRSRGMSDLVVVAPDAGGARRARSLARTLNNAPFAMVDKRRPRDEEIEIMHVIGDVSGLNCVVIDDMITTGRTIVGVAEALISNGARSVALYATHGVFSERALERLEAAPVTQVVVTDSVPIPDDTGSLNLVQLSLAPLLAEAILRVHEERSISELFD
ncbi:MAG: ribose-phosphate diphosphokinase [Candidatus Dormibacteria bacterium]